MTPADSANRVIDGSEEFEFRDRSTGISEILVVRGFPTQTNRIIFGGDTAEPDLIGDSGHDRIYGGGGDDRIAGGSGNDYLEGQGDNDTLYGGAGGDHLIGGLGNDTLNGDEGFDTYLFKANEGKDTITDSDGIGRIMAGGQQLSGASGARHSLIGRKQAWESDDGTLTYVFEPGGKGATTGTLTITGASLGAGQISLTDFDLAKAQDGVLGIQLGQQSALELLTSGSNPFAQAGHQAQNGLTGLTEGQGKTVKCYLNAPARAGDTLRLCLTGSELSRFACCTGEETISFAQGEITLALQEGQTEIAFAFLNTGDVDSDATLQLTATFQPAQGEAASNTLTIHLDATDEAPDTLPQPGTTINGDQRPALDEFGNVRYDAWGNVVPDGPEPGRADTLHDTPESDLILAGDGNDEVWKLRGGDDIVELGAGDDDLYTSTGAGGRVIARGGAGRDYLGAGSARDVLEGGPDGDGFVSVSGNDRRAASNAYEARSMSNSKPSPLNTCSGFLRYSGSRTLSLVVLFCGLTGTGYAQVEQYKYRLEQSQDKDLCVHMTKVFNQKFKTPWDKGQKPWKPNPTIFGKPYDQVFDRLSGVEYSLDFTWDMLLSKFPASAEFDAVKWKEGRVYYSDGRPSPYRRAGPMLVANIDIDNDGKKEWVVKHLFMQKMPTNMVSGTGNQDYSGSDTLTIFPSDGLDLTIPLTLEDLIHGQTPNRQPRKIDDEVALQLRPFLYKDTTYLSAYQIVWYDKDISRSKSHRYRIYPDREYLNILRVNSGGRHLHSSIVETANTETVCRIRMIMLNSAAAPKGN
jgi:hypothetical protein